MMEGLFLPAVVECDCVEELARPFPSPSYVGSERGPWS
jgi:hypothetical protein